MKIVDVVLKVILSLILALPVAGVTGYLGEATRDLYNTDQAFAFITMLTDVMYITYMMVAVHIVALIALWTRREPLAVLLIAPITANVFAFHLVLDGGIFTAGAVLANIMLLINVYFLYKYRDAYRSLLEPRKGNA